MIILLLVICIVVLLCYFHFKKEKERKNNEATDKEYIEKLKQFKTNHNEEKMKRISYQRRCTSLMNKLDTETEKTNVLTDLIKGTFLNILNDSNYGK